ncbi:hypothetical protein [Pseudomonas sp. PIC25]|uniref:hypothetical protein n=1 Tax=Pseudomonas sp. PIC25 TaxID=1958773 RepID=UPI00117A007A|nr:hypothetical protein [Pseudomonas sp. PIC25]
MTQSLFPATSLSYAEARERLIQLLSECASKLSDADWRAGYERIDALEEDDVLDLVTDAALFSFRGKRRAIDRILPKLKAGDELSARLMEGLAGALFSVFEIARIDNDQIILRDVLDNGRERVMTDLSLARSGRPGLVFAARLIDVGPWYMGLGIVLPLDKSEALAIAMFLETGARDDLHELVYHCTVHDISLVHAIVMPMVDAFCEELDEDDKPVCELMEELGSRSGLLSRIER